MRPGLRRFLHACSPLVVLPALWWDWEDVRTLLVVLAAGAVVLEVLRLKVAGVRSVLDRLPVWRARERSVASGASWLAVAFAAVARAPMDAALGGILAAAWADPAGSLVGRWLGRGDGKSIAGSLAVLAVATAAVVLVGYPPAVAVVAGLSGAMCERWAVTPDDNLWLAPGVTLVLVAFA